MKWIRIGKGSYNVAYRSEDSRLVFKVAQDDSPTDIPERSVRLWNLLNPNLQPPAQVSRQKISGKWVTGWTCPFVVGVQASDKEIRQGLIDVFNRTGRIIMDAVAPDNFLKTRNGDIVCIDIGHALEMEKRESLALVGMTRKPSFTSLDTWDELYDSPNGASWLNRNQKYFPKSILTVKALLFIKQHRPDITNVNFLKKSPKTIKLLAKAYDKGKGVIFRQALDILEVKRSPDLENSKQKCREIMGEFLLSKGKIENNEYFIPFKKYRFDEERLQEIMNLMRQINNASSCEECYDIINAHIEKLQEHELELEQQPESPRLPEQMSTEAETGSDLKSDTSHEVVSDDDLKKDSNIEDFGQFLEDFEQEVDGLLVLYDLKNKCRTIVSTVLLSHGQALEAATFATDSPDITQYKNELSHARIKSKVEILLKQIDFTRNFEELLRCLDAFAEEIPNPESLSSNDPFVLAEVSLIQSVNLCRMMVMSAINVENGPGLKSIVAVF